VAAEDRDGPAALDDLDDDAGTEADAASALDQTAVAAPAAKRKTEAVPVAVPAPGSTLHEQPTQQIPATRGLPTASADDTRQATTATTPLDALRGEEVVRTRLFLKICIAIVAASVGAVMVAGGDPYARVAVSAGCALVVGASSWLLYLSRDPAGFTMPRLTVTAILIAIGAQGGVYYWGVVSPVCALILYGIYFFSFGASIRATFTIYLLCAVMHAAIAIPIIAGWIDDRGIIKTTSLTLRDQVVSQLVIQFLYLCAFVTARASRRTMIDAIDKLERAVRAVSQREALLAEARAELDRALRVGGPGRYTEQVIGSYRLGLLIGRGGMGEVYDATSVHDGGEAAVKLLHPQTLSDPHQVRRFLRETEAAARLDSPHVVSVLEVGTTSGEIPFLAMERLRGFDLAHHLRRKRKLSLAQVVEMVRQVGAGLSVARDSGIVHRDLKPHNLFLAEKDGKLRWKILDFGVSKVGRTGTLTRGHVVGTPGYMAPEQARGDDVDWRADLYALGAIVYRSLTGHPPFTGKDVPSTLYDVVYKMPTRPSALGELGEDVDRVLAIAMAKRADDRFADATELADALAAAAGASLDAGLRTRADELIDRHPWGQRK
jgi:eukaryotic-like serine/threonine-protein kinase